MRINRCDQLQPRWSYDRAGEDKRHSGITCVCVCCFARTMDLVDLNLLSSSKLLSMLFFFLYLHGFIDGAVLNIADFSDYTRETEVMSMDWKLFSQLPAQM